MASPSSSQMQWAATPGPRPAAAPTTGSRRRRGALVLVIAAVGVATVVAAGVLARSGGLGSLGLGSSGSVAGTAAPRPSGWRYVSWSDPAMEIAVPSDWNTQDMTPIDVDPSLSPDQRAAQELTNAWIRKGAFRLSVSSAGGSSATTLDWAGVLVESGDASLQAFADRSIGESPFMSPASRVDVQLPSGPAVLVEYIGHIGDWPPFVETDYLIRLPDGRSMTIWVTASMNDSSAPDATRLGTFARQVVDTLRPVP